MELVAKGYTNKAIAEELHYETSSVYAFIRNIYKKYHLKTNSEYHRRVKAVLMFLGKGKR